MSTSLQLVASSEIIASTCSKLQLHKSSHSSLKHIRKCKENHFKPKYCKELKKKLKKYKLRRDGQEDQEVLNVSKILVSSLKIKSPNIEEDKNKLTNVCFEELRPQNYIFKMGRKKQIVSKNGPNVVTNQAERNISSSTPVNKISGFTVLREKSDVIHSADIQNMENVSLITSKDKAQTNAFKLMMDSRSKSIGSNSPGKEKVLDNCEVQEAIEKKNIKAKRILVLQKMAEDKGALKKKEIEDYQEKIIKKKMDKRAERLKKMITYHNNSKNKDSNTTDNKSVVLKYPDIKKDIVAFHNKKMKLVDLFQESTKDLKNTITKKNKISKEDQDFLKKLSPSLKKKENMLSYFKKIEHDDESRNGGINFNEAENGDVEIEDTLDSVAIKVKITPKLKKKIKKKKLSLNKDSQSCNLQQTDYIDNKLNSKEKENSQTIENNNIIDQNCDIIATSETVKDDMTRPRRNVKRPAKYVDEVQLSSSDEDLHIFTPKKKKHGESKDYFYDKIHTNDRMLPKSDKQIDNKTKLTKTNLKKIQSKVDMKMNNKLAKDNINLKKLTKLAPIFNLKPTLDTAAIEAKQRFLNSGVPEMLKKSSEKQESKKLFQNSFQTVVHVQQTESKTFESCEVDFNLRNIDDECNLANEKDLFGKLLYQINSRVKTGNLNQLPTKVKTQVLLQNIKEINPKFPVYRTYRLLKEKSKGDLRDYNFFDLDNSIEILNSIIDVNNENPGTLNWTAKYKPITSKQLIGNFETIKELKKWLISWTENDVKLNRYNNDCDSSDFYYSDTDSKDSIRSSNNLLILTGPVGSGKTSMVYAVAAELAIKVLEVNASSKRTGKIMLQDLQEATQSHKVNRAKGSGPESSQRLEEIEVQVLKKHKKRGRPKKELHKKRTQHINNCEPLSQSQASQESTRTCMSLILIDDADIVFDQDDGFCSAIVQLVQCSKRPVILIASSLKCPHLQRFLNSGKVMHTRPFLPTMLGIWLDIMCLAENNLCWPGLGARFLDYYNGDIRKTINCLQFYLTKEASNEEETASQSSDYYKNKMEDENSNMCWSDCDGMDERIDTINLNKVDAIWQYFMSDQIDLLHYTYPLRLFNIWWNIPALLDIPLRVQYENKKPNKVSTKSLELETISNVFDTVSVSDYFRQDGMRIENNVTDDPWQCIENHSISEQENLENYNKCNEVMDEILHSLVTGVIMDAQHKLGLECKSDIKFPDITDKRQRNGIVSRHNNLTKYLNPSAVLDRKALALDYWSTSRTICRLEKTKTDSNSKRNNRFCHYLKSVNILCNNDSFDNLGNSLCTAKENL